MNVSTFRRENKGNNVSIFGKTGGSNVSVFGKSGGSNVGVLARSGGGIVKASSYGFLPTASASENVAAWNSIPAGRNVVIDVAGTYDVNNYMLLKSNTTYTFTSGCTIRKATGSSFKYVFLNERALSSGIDTNIKFFGGGLTINVNDITSSAEPVPRMRGQFSLYKVSNSIFAGVTTTTGTTEQYFGHFCDINSCIFDNWNISCWKDGMHFGTTNDSLIKNITASTGDDTIIFDAGCYVEVNPKIGPSQRNILENITFGTYPGAGGLNIAMFPMSWANWTNSNSYQKSDVVVNGGRIYQKYDLGTKTGTVAPTHSTGRVTGADGITWEYVQDGTETSALITDLTVKNCTWNNSKYFIGNRSDASTAFRLIYPGTYGNGYCDNIIVENLTTTNQAQYLFYSTDYTKDFTFKGCTFEVQTEPIAMRPGVIGSATIESLTFDDCNLTINGNVGLMSIPNTALNYITDTINFVDSELRSVNRRNMLPTRQAQTIKTVNITRSNLRHWEALFEITDACSGLNITVNWTGGKLYDLPYFFMYNDAATSSTFTFNGDGVEWEEPRNYLFRNNQASSTMVVNSVNSIGDTFPSAKLNSGAGVITLTGCDLVTKIGSNIWNTGKFYELIGTNLAQLGTLTWNAGKYAVYTANGTAGNNTIYQAIANALSNNIRVTFRAKSPTATNTMSTNQSLTAIANPALTTEWQNYRFEGARGASSGNFFINLGTSLANGTEIHIDDIQIIQL